MEMEIEIERLALRYCTLLHLGSRMVQQGPRLVGPTMLWRMQLFVYWCSIKALEATSASFSRSKPWVRSSSHNNAPSPKCVGPSPDIPCNSMRAICRFKVIWSWDMYRNATSDPSISEDPLNRKAEVKWWKNWPASEPSIPNVESTNGTKVTLLSAHSREYFWIFTRSISCTASIPVLTKSKNRHGEPEKIDRLSTMKEIARSMGVRGRRSHPPLAGSPQAAPARERWGA